MPFDSITLPPRTEGIEEDSWQNLSKKNKSDILGYDILKGQMTRLDFMIWGPTNKGSISLLASGAKIFMSESYIDNPITFG